MTSRRGRLALAGCLALVIVPAATAAKTRTIVVISNTVTFSRHDVAPKGASKGDTVVYRDRLVNAAAQFGKQKGALVGSDAGTLTFTSANTAALQGNRPAAGRDAQDLRRRLHLARRTSSSSRSRAARAPSRARRAR